MTLSRKIAAALEARPESGALPCTVPVEAGSSRLTLNLTAAGAVGVAFDRLDFADIDRADWSTDDLRAWGDRLSARLTYLMEPLVVLEVDPVGGEVELRSQAPTSRNEPRSYYEIRLRRDGTLHLGRLAVDESTRRRRPVPCQMTREALERLADDLVASVG